METNLPITTSNSVPEATITINMPDRFRRNNITRQQAIVEVRHLGFVVARTITAVGGVYMRICDAVRDFKLTDSEVRDALKGCFQDSRISDIIRVANSPDEVYHRWKAGFFGFRMALKECRYYRISPPARLIQKRKQRAAARLASLVTEDEEIRVSSWVVRVQRV